MARSRCGSGRLAAEDRVSVARVARWQMVEDTAEALRAEIDHLRRLRLFVTDARVLAEIKKMIEELELRLRELEQ
jgi:hypothetical protein